MNIFSSFFAIILTFSGLNSYAQCQADTIVFLSNFEFSPSELVIPIGQTVAFINLEGNHNLNGITNTVTNEPFNNPQDYFLNDTIGNEQGVCMGTITFDTPGVYNFDCGLNFNAQFGMNLSITVDAFDLNDLFLDMQQNQIPIFQSYYAFNSFTPEKLTNEGPWTLFVPNDEAVNEILEYMNLGQFDALNIPDFAEIMNYHIAPGIWTQEDLSNGLLLTSAQGQSLSITQNAQSVFVNNAQIISTNYMAYNGIIHIIDKCLAPQGLPGAHVMQVIKESPNHQILEEAVINVGYDDDLSFQVLIDDSYDSPGPWTVFAPTDSAFGIFAQELGLTNEELLESQFLNSIVSNHIVQNQTTSTEMYSGNFVTNIGGNALQFEYSDSSFFVIGNENTVEISVTDVYAYNGVVHVVDAVVKPFIPVIEGSCGIWRLELQTTSAEEGWGEHYLYLEVNGTLTETITVFEGSSSQSYEFGVDYGDEINVYFVPINYVDGNISYKLYNQENQLIVQETESGNSQIGSTVGLIACQSVGEEYCGEITIKSYSYFDEGWLTASLEVYRNNQLALEVPMPFGGLQTTYLEANYNDVFSFEYNSGGFLIEDIGYEIYDVSGQLVIDENTNNETLQSYSDILICEAIMGTYNCINDACIDPLDGSGSFNSLNDCQQECQNISSLEEQNLNTNIYPNPSSNVFNLEFYSEKRNIELIVTTVLGNEVYYKKINAIGHYNAPIDLSNYSKGIYNLSIKTEDTISNYKLILQ
jgi:uncharacterized surface protein with fasciclin (FAS1) repeats/plastocyanin